MRMPVDSTSVASMLYQFSGSSKQTSLADFVHKATDLGQLLYGQMLTFAIRMISF